MVSRYGCSRTLQYRSVRCPMSSNVGSGTRCTAHGSTTGPTSHAHATGVVEDDIKVSSLALPAKSRIIVPKTVNSLIGVSDTVPAARLSPPHCLDCLFYGNRGRKTLVRSCDSFVYHLYPLSQTSTSTLCSPM